MMKKIWDKMSSELKMCSSISVISILWMCISFWLICEVDNTAWTLIGVAFLIMSFFGICAGGVGLVGVYEKWLKDTGIDDFED